MDVTGVLLDILIVLVAAKVAAELAERVHAPGVVAEILAGVIIGPSVLALVGTNETLAVLGELGVILLLLQVGLEMNLGELRAVGRASMLVACVGVVIPMATGFGVAELFAYDSNTALFLGSALAATSVGITARVFSDLRALGTVEARTVLGAAVADDVLGLVILTVVVRIVAEGTIALGTLVEIIAVAVGFLIIAAAVGSRTAPPVFSWLQRRARSAGTLVALALAFTLMLAELADAAKLAPIVGAFVAGLALSRSDAKERIERELAPVGHLFIPIFFLQIGVQVDVEKFIDPSVLGIAGALLVCAIVGKLLAAVGAFGSPGDKWLIGLGMLPRGEVGLIFATIGLQTGVLGDKLYAALLLVVLATTLIAPPLLRWRLLALRKRPMFRGPVVPMPDAGWLRTDHGVIELAAIPPDHVALSVGLEAALALAAPNARPGTKLLDWLGSLGEVALYWDDDATRRLFAVLREGGPRSWRFLETTGLLERALPELAAAVARRRADPFLIEPAHVLRFALVEAVHAVEANDPAAAAVSAQLEHPEWLLLAALLLDATGDQTEPVGLARRLVGRLDLGAAAEEEIALLVGDVHLLEGAAERVDGLDPERVLPLAIHLDQVERARALYVLTLALGELEPADRGRLDELFGLVLAVLERPDLGGREARNLVERRRTEALALIDGAPAIAPDIAPDVASRIERAPRGYLLSQEATDIARQAAVLEPLPGRGRARVAVGALGTNEWRIEVAQRDRPGLLAVVAGVLADFGLDVFDAVIATWPDGGALQSFRVRRALLDPAQLAPEQIERAGPPAAAALEGAIVAALDRPLEAAPNPDAEITFDDAGSPWYTLCEVRSPDRRGLLHAITVGIAAAGADVHSARLATTGATALDRFELTDRNGRKLGAELEEAIVTSIRLGATASRRRVFRRTR